MAAHKTDVISWCWKTPWRRCRSSSLCKRRARSTPRQWRSWRSPAVEFLMLPNTTSSTGNPSGSKTPSPTGQWSKHVRLAQIVFWYRELCNRLWTPCAVGLYSIYLPMLLCNVLTAELRKWLRKWLLQPLQFVLGRWKPQLCAAHQPNHNLLTPRFLYNVCLFDMLYLRLRRE